jgi:aryl-alcohol dehydrogenase-like predicted oxidoreductase
VPFDEGTLTGTLTKDSTWPEGDWRNTYFVPENLIPSVERADAVKKALEEWNREHSTKITMPELALRFILGNEDVSTIIPGMRKLRHVEANIEASDAGPLPAELQEKMRGFRWVRKPAPWSQ